MSLNPLNMSPKSDTENTFYSKRTHSLVVMRIISTRCCVCVGLSLSLSLSCPPLSLSLCLALDLSLPLSLSLSLSRARARSLTLSLSHSLSLTHTLSLSVYRVLKGHEHYINTLLCSKGRLYSGSMDKTIRVWD